MDLTTRCFISLKRNNFFMISSLGIYKLNPIGFVTNARVSHATPAALYAHSAFRDWECNKIGMDGSLDSSDITWQLIHNNPGRNAKVILGGGRSSFLPFIQTEETARCRVRRIGMTY